MATPTPLIRIVDDDPTLRQALSLYFRMQKLASVLYETAFEFLEKDNFRQPGCLILDVRMPGMTGLELQREMKKQSIDLPVIFLSAHGDIEMAAECVRKGAYHFLVKPPEPERLLELARKASNESILRQREIELIARMKKKFETLTPAEKRVAVIVAKGFSGPKTAELLGISERTVQMHRLNIYDKLDIKNAVELYEYLRDLQDEGVGL